MSQADSTEFRRLLGGPIRLPLYDDDSPMERYIHLGVGAITLILVLVTISLGFFYHLPPDGRNIFSCFCILSLCCVHCILIHWYRQGDIDPKFRTFIYVNTVIIVMFCISGMTYFTMPKCS